MLAAATGAPIDERCQSRVVPARAGTRRSNDAVGRSVINHVDRWLWVPAFAGTTQRVGGPTTPTCPTGKSPVSCPAPSKKIFLLATDPTQTYIPRHPVPLRGTARDVTDAGRDAVDADARLTGDAEADGEVVWS